MPGKSPGRKTQQHALIGTSMTLPSTQLDVSVRGRVKRPFEFLDSDDEGKVLGARRLKYQSASPARKRIIPSDLDVGRSGGQKSPRQYPRTPEESTPKQESLKLAAHGQHEQEHGKSNASDRWPIAYRHSSSLFDYGSQDSHAVKINSPGRVAMVHIPGGFKPLNTLNENNSNSSTSTRVASRPKPTTQKPPFDLHGSAYKKRRRNSITGGTITSLHTIDRDTIEESPTRDNRASLEPAAKFSVQSSGISNVPKNKNTRFGLHTAEYHSVEARMSESNKRKRTRTPNQDSRVNNNHSHTGEQPGFYQRLAERKRGNYSINKAELEDDPIQESDSRTPYQGSANLGPPRKKRASDASDFVSTATSSLQNRLPAKVTKSVLTPNQTIRQRRLSWTTTIHSAYVEEDSLDQLSLDHPNTKATVLSKSLSTEGNIHRSPWNSSGKNARSMKSQGTTASIVASNSKQPKLLSVVKVLTESKTYSFDASRKQAAFRYDEASKTFELVHIEDTVITTQRPDLKVHIEKVTKVETNSTSPKAIIWRSSDTSIRNFSTKVYIEFIDAATADQFDQTLFQNGSSIKRLSKDAGQLDKVFDNLEAGDLKASIDSEDLELMRTNNKRRADSDASSQKRIAAASDNQHLRSELDVNIYGLVKTGLVQNMQGRSAVEIDAESELESRDRFDEILPRRTSTRHRDQGTAIGIDTHDVLEATAQVGRRSRQPAKSPTPPPERWSSQNSRYKNTLSKSLCWPNDSKKKVMVDVGDIERLDEGEFLNDNLIAFYLRYLEHRLELKNRKDFERIYFQNTFFYKTLSSGRGRNSINYDAVKRWTKGDIFKYDYIIVPVNENFHWYLAIICHPGKLLIPEDSLTTESGDGHDTSIIVSTTRAGIDSAEAEVTTIDVDQLGMTQGRAPQNRSSSPEIRNKVEQMSLEDSGSPAAADYQAPRGLASDSSRDPKVGDIDNDTPQDERSPRRSALEIAKMDLEVPRSPRGKKAKKKPPPRLHDPSKPRIITLDSLHTPHSPTCRRLREWLISEAKEKRDTEISGYATLGTTAMAIPRQPNFCDCGLFLLGYVEKFLKDPDTFISDILQKKMSVERDWPDMDASRMRCDIRALIFKLHDEQQTRIEDENPRKNEPKRVEVAVENPITVIPGEAEEARIDSDSSETTKSHVVATPYLADGFAKAFESTSPRRRLGSQKIDSAVTEAMLERGSYHASPQNSPVSLRTSHVPEVGYKGRNDSPLEEHKSNIMKQFAKHPPNDAVALDGPDDEPEILQDRLTPSLHSLSTITEPIQMAKSLNDAPTSPGNEGLTETPGVRVHGRGRSEASVQRAQSRQPTSDEARITKARPAIPTARAITPSRITRSSPQQLCHQGREPTWDKKKKRADEDPHVISDSD